MVFKPQIRCCVASRDGSLPNELCATEIAVLPSGDGKVASSQVCVRGKSVTRNIMSAAARWIFVGVYWDGDVGVDVDFEGGGEVEVGGGVGLTEGGVVYMC